MSRKEKIFLITSISYIVYVLFPLFADITGIPIHIPSLLVFLVLLVIYPKSFINKPTFWFFCYAYVLFMFLAFQKPLTIGIGTVHDSKKIIIEYAFILPSLSIFNVLDFLKKKELYKILFKTSIITLILSFIYILPILLLNENVLRINEESLAELGNIKGLPNYTLMHAYTMLCPVLFYGVKVSNGKLKIIMLFATALTIYVIFKTYVTTSLVILVIVGILILIYKENNKSRTLLTACLISGLTLFVIKSGVMLGFLETIEPVFENTAVSPKITDFKSSLIAGEVKGGTITGRSSLHDKSKNSFVKNPLIGASGVDSSAGGAGNIGGHSAILDRLGGMGLVATIPFIMILISSFFRVSRSLKTERSKFYFLLGQGVIFGFLYMKGLFGNEGWLMSLVMLPVGIMYFNYYHESENIKVIK